MPYIKTGRAVTDVLKYYVQSIKIVKILKLERRSK
jgi:hypothetical protein